ncbi:MAG: TRAP transporter substrate-binding protein DctP [Rhodospirillales bacterium]|nr:TRAP transporter substrate-binding protein DctP [Rhodospirillales bacterium]
MTIKHSYLAAVIAATALGLVAAPVQSAEVTLNGASCFPAGSPVSKPWEKYISAVNQRGKGVVQIKLVGGAPAIGSPFTLVQKMARGAYDIVGCPESYFGNVIPEAPVLRFSNHTYAKLRTNGGLDYVQKLLAVKNIHYVARHHDFGPFHLWLSKPISKPDLTGLNLRVAPVYTAFFKKLGATVQQAALPQIYTLMENGTVQGYGWPALGWVPSWVKVTKYRVEPGFYHASLHTLANLKKWKSLSKAQRDLLTKVGLEFETRSESTHPGFKATLDAQNAKTLKQGLKAINFTGKDAKFWLKTAETEGWNEVIERSPVHGPALKKLFTK